jgi:hypothetical protein
VSGVSGLSSANVESGVAGGAGRRGRRSSFDVGAAFATNSVVKSLVDKEGFGTDNSEAVLAGLNLVYKMLCQCADESTTAVFKYNTWLGLQNQQLEDKIREEEENEMLRNVDKERMGKEDILDEKMKASLGPHLKQLGKTESRERVTAR